MKLFDPAHVVGVFRGFSGSGMEFHADLVLPYRELVYAGDDPRAKAEDWMVRLSPPILPRFQVAQLASRRSFVFARAGFGKSNLIKLLFSRLYATDPLLGSRGGQAKVGTIIFDPDGEYFWPDAHGRPGLSDVPELPERLVVFTAPRARRVQPAHVKRPRVVMGQGAGLAGSGRAP